MVNMWSVKWRPNGSFSGSSKRGFSFPCGDQFPGDIHVRTSLFFEFLNLSEWRSFVKGESAGQRALTQSLIGAHIAVGQQDDDLAAGEVKRTHICSLISS